MKKTFLLLGLALCLSCSTRSQQPVDARSASDSDSVRTLTLLFAGDLMQHQGQINAARQSDGTYAYDCFDPVRPLIEGADLAIANLEVTLGGTPYKGYPQFSAPDEYLIAARDAGFDVLLTANNHCCDTHGRGIVRTLDKLDSLQIPHCGTYRNAGERTREYPLIVEKNGFRIALLNYTYGTNGIPVPSPCVVNLIDKAQMAADIARAKAMKPDAIIANMHWGIEYVHEPNGEQRELADWLLAQGVDHVIGGHPHVIQPCEVRPDSKGQHLVVYSLGNYVSNMTKPATTGGLMVSLVLEKRSGKTRYADSSFSYVWVSRPVHNGRNTYQIYPASYPQDKLNASEREGMNAFLRSMRTLMNSKCKGIKEI